jgi:hypothetical protein
MHNVSTASLIGAFVDDNLGEAGLETVASFSAGAGRGKLETQHREL